MNTIVDSLLSNLQSSKTELSPENIKKIHRFIPVPTDYKILWADILNFGGHPAGIVITDKALIVKSTKDEVRQANKDIKANNKELKDKSKKIQPLKSIYQIIPWEYYSPEDYNITSYLDDNGEKRFYFKAGEQKLAQFSSNELCNSFIRVNQKLRDEQKSAEEIMESSSFSAINSYNVEGTMFNAAYGVDQTKTGHGIYAEEAGAKLDFLYGEKSTVVGRDNAKNGPDKIVNSNPVQCKYCKTAGGSVGACFKRNSEGNMTYRYYDLTGNPMKVEVPSDQYTQAIESMKARIEKGQVPGVSDPDAAYDIIRRGKLSYKQALNLAKAGTVESITYDAATGAVNCLSVLGITSVVTFAQIFWSTKDYKKAAKGGLIAGFQVYGFSFVGGILASQISRTGATDAIMPLATKITQKLSPKFVNSVVNAFRALAGKDAITGITAQKSFAKALSSNMIAEGVMFLVFSIPDTFNVINRKISVAQYVKNMLSLVAAFGGSIGGTFLAGSLIGGAAGGTVNKTVGKVGGFVAGGVCGVLGGGAVRAIGDIFHEDDSRVTTRLFNAVLANMLIDYLLSENEIENVINVLDQKGKDLNKLQKSLLKSNSQSQDIVNYLTPIIENVVKKREKIDDNSNAELHNQINDIIMNGELAYGM